MLIDILYDPWVCSDGGVIISAGSYEMQKRFLTSIDMQHLLEDERFATFENQMRNIHVLKGLVSERCAELVATTWWGGYAKSMCPVPRS